MLEQHVLDAAVAYVAMLDTDPAAASKRIHELRRAARRLRDARDAETAALASESPSAARSGVVPPNDTETPSAHPDDCPGWICLHCGPRWRWHHAMDCGPNDSIPCQVCAGGSLTERYGPPQPGTHESDLGQRTPVVEARYIDTLLEFQRAQAWSRAHTPKEPQA